MKHGVLLIIFVLYLNEMPFCLIFCHIMPKKKKSCFFSKILFVATVFSCYFLVLKNPFPEKNILCSVMDVFVTFSICNIANI